MTWWGPAVVTTVVLAHLLLPEPPPAADLVSMIVLTVVFGQLGLRILRMTDTQWSGSRQAEMPVAAHA
jgi:hypothetical protein